MGVKGVGILGSQLHQSGMLHIRGHSCSAYSAIRVGLYHRVQVVFLFVGQEEHRFRPTGFPLWVPHPADNHTLLADSSILLQHICRIYIASHPLVHSLTEYIYTL
jgi:hypothetical protein